MAPDPDGAHELTTAPRTSGLLDTAGRVGRLAWVERRLFECLGRWSGDVADPSLAVHLGVHSRRHGWHSELLVERLPELRELESGRLVDAGDDVRRFVDAVCEPGDGAAGLELLVGVYRVLLPAMLVSYRSVAAGARSVSDAALLRSLGFIEADQLQEWVSGIQLLDALLTDRAALERAAHHQQRLERLRLECAPPTP